MDTYDVDFKLDIGDEEPLQIKYLVNRVAEYRPITKQDKNLYEFLSNAQKNNLNKIGMLVSGQIKVEADFHKSLQLTMTQHIHEIWYQSYSVMIHENQTKKQIELDKIELEKQFTNANITKALTIVIVNPQNIQNLEFNGFQFDHDDQCYGKFKIDIQNKIIYLIPKSKQSKIQLMQLIFLGLARHFKPRYLYIQELNYKLQDNIFLKTTFNSWGAICPKKIYDGKRNDPLFLEFLIKYDFYVRMQNDGDSYQFDALNCFYNYQKSDNQIINFISCQANESLTQDMDHLNPKFCKLLNQDNLCLIQYGQLKQNPYDNISDINQKIQSIKLNQEIKFMIHQYIELNPSVFRVLLMKLISIIEYFSISSYLFIIVILPYYFILDQSDNQAIQVFISIIPGFIIILLMILAIIVTVIFSIDDQIFAGFQKYNEPFYIFKKDQVSTLVFSLNDEKEKYQIIPSDGKVEKKQLLFKLNPEKLREGPNKINASPVLWFNPTEIPIKWVIIFFSVFYFILSTAVLIIFITNRGGDSNKMAYSTAAFLAILLIFYFIFACRSLDYSQIGYKILHLIPMFIEINLLADIFISYNKSHNLEQNYQGIQKFLLRIFWNFILFFTYIVLDYSFNFDGGVICPIVGYYVLKYITQIILLAQASKKLKESQYDKQESSDSTGEKLINEMADQVNEAFKIQQTVDKKDDQNQNDEKNEQKKDGQDSQNRQKIPEAIQTKSVFTTNQEHQSHKEQQNDGQQNTHQEHQIQQNLHNQNQNPQPVKPVSGFDEQKKQNLSQLFPKI